jgi:ABC-type Fe3+ transport system substrate-binding protein
VINAPHRLQRFTSQYGIQVEYLGGAGNQHLPRMDLEFAAGQTTVDLFLNGPQTPIPGMYPKGMFAPLQPTLLLPEVGCGNWLTADGCPWFLDPEQQYIVRLGNMVGSSVVYANTRQVAPTSITGWADLLGPRFKGRLAAEDPGAAGPGAETVRYLLETQGEDYVRQLYQGQQVTLATDQRQLADWLARGATDIVLHATPDTMQQVIADGFPIEPVEIQSPPGYVSGGWLAALARMKNAPHPRAATVLTNWLLTRDGVEMLGRATRYPVVRKDAPNDWVPAYVVPRPGVQYIDHHTWDYILNTAAELDATRVRLFPR